VTSEPGKAQNVNHEPDHGVVAYLKERDRPKQSMAPITKGTWILTPVRGCARQLPIPLIRGKHSLASVVRSAFCGLPSNEARRVYSEGVS
jgi:hypothetical protein